MSIRLAGKTTVVRVKRISGKQRVARVKNIATARRAKARIKAGTKRSKGKLTTSEQYQKSECQKTGGKWNNKEKKCEKKVELGI